MVFRPLWIWLVVGFVLVFIFGLQLYLSLKLFMRAGSKKQKGDVIDIQAQALDEQDK
jgi:cytochrome c-type biogenesis protein CcmH/NrfG